MADFPSALTGLSALLVAVVGVGVSATAAAPVVTAPATVVAPVGSPTVIAGASVAGFGNAPLRLVITVTSGALGLSSSATAVTVPDGYPGLGATGPQLAIEGNETAVNIALGELSWVPTEAGPAEVRLDAAPAGAAYEPDGAHFFQLVASPTPLSWNAARDAAEARTFEGIAGSLAAVTTDAEQALLTRIAPVDAWVGIASLGSPEGVRWAAQPDPTASIASYIVEYADSLNEGGPVVGRAIAPVRAALPPAAPLVSDVSAATGEATVRWQQPPADGGAPVLGYVVTGDPAGWCAVAPTQTSCVLRGLVGGAAHTFRVAALNEVGLGPWSAPSGPVTPKTSTTLVLTTSPAAPTVGQPVQLVATVSGTSGAPTGTVTFLDGDRELGSGPVGAAFAATDLGVGWHRLAARYGGDEMFGASLGGGIDLYVSRAATPTDAVNITVQPFPAEAPTGGTVADTTAPTTPAVEDTGAPSDGGSGASATTAAPSTGAATTTVPAATDSRVGADVAGSSTTTVDTSSVPEVADTTTVDPGSESGSEPVIASLGTGGPGLTVVFDVGPGAELAAARFTVRGKGLSPGTVVSVVAHSEPVVVGTVDVGADGTVTWVGQLPAGLADGDHELIAEGVGHDGSKVKRTMSLAAESGRLVRIGATSLQTIAPTAATTIPAADPTADVAAAATGASGGGGLPRKAAAAALVLLAAATLWWRARSRRTRGQNAQTTEQPAAADAADAPRVGRTARAATTPDHRRHARRAPRRAGRRPVRST